MSYDELNHFILNYLNNDITGRAIMLTGKWGSGKSYYIAHTLKPFLKSDEGGKHKCVIVSLYGLSDISEISKAIYVDLRTIKTTESEVGNTVKVISKIIGKTVMNGLVSKIGFDVGNITDEDLQKVYESIDLSDKLIVLEDIERTQIDLIELLGYVNNMCENDGVKVLLVANETEILQSHMEKKTIHKNGKDELVSVKVYSETAQKYLKAKEKSVSDTLCFHANTQQTIDSIIDRFKNNDLSRFKGCIQSANHSIFRNEIKNYREVIVACQKTCDIYNYMNEHNIDADDEFKKCVLIGLVNYLQNRLNKPDLEFESHALFDSKLSEDDIYPLMRICYDYYHDQTIQKAEILKAIDEYKEYTIYIDKKTYDDKDLKVLYSLFIHTENDINNAINSINARLDNISDIGLNHYGIIINCLLILKYDAHLENCKIDEIISKIICNLKGRGDKINKNHGLFSHTIAIQNPEGIEKFEEIQQKVYESLENKPDAVSSFDALSYAERLSKISNESIRQYNPNTLINMISLSEVMDHLSDFTAETMDDLRRILLEMDYTELNENNRTLITTLRQYIEKLLNNNTSLDCIQKMQLSWTCYAIDKNMGNYPDE